MNLADVISGIRVVQVIGNAENKVAESVTNDSRKVNGKTLFCAVKGYSTDGHKFIGEAISKGAPAIILEDDSNYPDEMFTRNSVVKILVEDSRIALSEASNIITGFPSRKLKLVGITGTKGKTTTAFFLKSIFEQSGQKSGLIGTIENWLGDRKIKAGRTTPESFELNQYFAEMVERGCGYCAMEVSSHGLALKRTFGMDFDGAIFTNITSDHMDFHLNFKNYLAAKKILFDSIKPEGIIAYNIDDPNYRDLIKDSRAVKKSYGFDEKADYRISDLRYDLNGTKFKINYNNTIVDIQTELIGKFNSYNIISAFVIGIELGLSKEQIIQGIKSTPHVPGRMELLSSGPKKVIVDYSHTAGSLKEALLAIRHIVGRSRPVYTVFGCGGDRDRTKRPEMGRIASELSDFVYVTSDNPRTEDPEKIIEEITTGINTNNFNSVVDRRRAIEFAIKKSEPNAVVLIAGKGHEDYFEINGKRTHFSDKETAFEFLGGSN